MHNNNNNNNGRRTDPLLIKKRKIIYHQVDLAVAEDQRVKIKESEKIEKYFDLARELKIKTVQHEGGGSANRSRWA